MKKIVVILILFFIVLSISNKVIKEFIQAEVVANIKGQELVSEEDNLYYDDFNDVCEYNLEDGEHSNDLAEAHKPMEFDRSGEIIEVEEENFLPHISDIYLHASEYIGKTIIYEGMFISKLDEETGKLYKYVLRYGPGCCTNHGVVGLEIFTDETYDDNSWVKVEGTLTDYQGTEYKHLVLDNVKIEVLEKRGKETVTH